MFILSLDFEDELTFNFTFTTRQTPVASGSLGANSTATASADTSITGLTFAYATNTKELDTLVTREFHNDPNLHRNSNVQLIGDYSTGGSPSVQYEWTWKYKPPRGPEGRSTGWRNSCSFLEYDSRAHRLNTLASFSFWVNNLDEGYTRPLLSPGIDLTGSMSRSRMVSSQSYQSTVSDSEAPAESIGPPSPPLTSESSTYSTNLTPLIDVSRQRPAGEFSAVEDGPLFRATMKSFEQKTGDMRIQLKKVLKKAEAAQQAQVDCNMAMKGFLLALQEAGHSSSSSAIKPALDHYFTKIARRILDYETDVGVQLQKQILEPFSKLYQLDIKQAEAKKKDFEDESRDYYAYVGRYLGQRQDSLKEKKRAESDSKYQVKKRNFELKRFDYSSFMQDLHGGRKEQELLSQLTRYADVQSRSFLATAKHVETLMPQLDTLVREVAEIDKDYKIKRTEREEKRRNLEKNTPFVAETELAGPTAFVNNVPPAPNGASADQLSDTDLNRADSNSSSLGPVYTTNSLSPSTSILRSMSSGNTSLSPSNQPVISNPNRFKGYRDLDDSQRLTTDGSNPTPQRKEGLLWALNKSVSHINPKEAWHKFWVVLDQGRLAEYSNWKDRLDPHGDPIDLRMAAVRPALHADRRFCFEVITPSRKEPRVYQATSDEDRINWISSINSAVQSAVEGQAAQLTPHKPVSEREGRTRDIGSILTGKSTSLSGSHSYHSMNSRSQSPGVNRRVTVGSRPSYIRTNSNSFDSHPTKLLERIRAADPGNSTCADCNSTSRVEWVSLNLGIILCIECSGIHRSLGTHISKIRSLTLDITSFTTDIVELLLLIGNRVSNMVWEAKLFDPTSNVANHIQKPNGQSTREVRHKFIVAKYKDRIFVDQITNVPTAGGADELLLTSIKRQDVKGVLHAIALRANLNAHDRSRGTHSVFMALAAADPAAPGTTPSVSPNTKIPIRPSSSSAAMPSPHHADSDPNTPLASLKPFPIAELLVQNGAAIPATLPTIPLTPASTAYIEQRSSTRSLNPVNNPSSKPHSGGSTDANGTNGSRDTLGPLPMRGLSERDRDRDVGATSTAAKLQKRGSAGARFAGKVASQLERGFSGSG